MPAQNSTLSREVRARASLERRALTEAEKSAGYIGAIKGVIPYNSDSEILSKRGRPKPFVEKIAPDAFKRSLSEDKDIMGFAGHTDDPLAALGRIGENITVTSDERSMTWEALVPDTQAGRDMLSLVDKKIIRGTSFEFEIRGAAGEKWEKRDDRLDERTILDAKLIAFNPVAWPAYSDSSLTVELRRRSRHDAGEEIDASESRGAYLSANGGGCVDWYDPTITPDTKFAGNALSRATWALTDALEYLRAVEAIATSGSAVKAGALVDYARAEVAASAANAKTLVDWLATNGAEVNPAAVQRARDKLAEARAATPPPAAPAAASATQSPDYDRERRARILNLSSQ
jgi:uncharacterized protein